MKGQNLGQGNERISFDIFLMKELITSLSILTLSLPKTYIYVVFYIPPQPKTTYIYVFDERERVNKLTSQFCQSDSVCHHDVTVM